MTKINIYCLFERNDNFYAVYSSLKAAHRDAIKLCNQGNSRVFLEIGGEYVAANIQNLRSVFNGEMDIQVRYSAGKHSAKIVKTKLKE